MCRKSLRFFLIRIAHQMQTPDFGRDKNYIFAPAPLFINYLFVLVTQKP